MTQTATALPPRSAACASSPLYPDRPGLQGLRGGRAAGELLRPGAAQPALLVRLVHARRGPAVERAPPPARRVPPLRLERPLQAGTTPTSTTSSGPPRRAARATRSGLGWRQDARLRRAAADGPEARRQLLGQPRRAARVPERRRRRRPSCSRSTPASATPTCGTRSATWTRRRARKWSLDFRGDHVDGQGRCRSSAGTFDLGHAAAPPPLLRLAAQRRPATRRGTTATTPSRTSTSAASATTGSTTATRSATASSTPFPALELNEVGGRNFVKSMLEWNLPPLRFRRVGNARLLPDLAAPGALRLGAGDRPRRRRPPPRASATRAASSTSASPCSRPRHDALRGLRRGLRGRLPAPTRRHGLAQGPAIDSYGSMPQHRGAAIACCRIAAAMLHGPTRAAAGARLPAGARAAGQLQAGAACARCCARSWPAPWPLSPRRSSRTAGCSTRPACRPRRSRATSPRWIEETAQGACRDLPAC